MNFFLNSCKDKSYYLNDNYSFEKWQQHREHLLKIKNYKIHGVLSGTFLQKNMHIQFIFQKINCKCYRLIFFHPIGLKNIEFNILENRECSINNDRIENFLSICNFEKIVKYLTHLDISFNNFKNWVLGLPGTGGDFRLNSSGYLKKIFYFHNDVPFTILYKNYFDNQTPCLPRIIEIHDNNNYYFNIKIYKWIIL